MQIAHVEDVLELAGEGGVCAGGGAECVACELVEGPVLLHGGLEAHTELHPVGHVRHAHRKAKGAQEALHRQLLQAQAVPLQQLHVLALSFREEDHRAARVHHARRPPNSVNIFCCFSWGVVLHDPVNASDVKATRGDVGADHDAGLGALELLEGADAFGELHVAVQLEDPAAEHGRVHRAAPIARVCQARALLWRGVCLGHEARAGEEVVEELCAVRRRHEHQHLARALEAGLEADERGEGDELALGGRDDEVLLEVVGHAELLLLAAAVLHLLLSGHGLVLRIIAVEREIGRLVEGEARQLLHSLAERCRDEQCLTPSADA
mmetsp:Transcript_8208/g.34467  ORF Transcript_8208/g.34467 Transcript_8208/m.34467 type:complete len:323 (-) Transcript_8208:1196-2164(-)